jgi:glycosyltransferase involved in cell wall biosynthesis
MRIGFDARILTVPRCGGVTYLACLLEWLLRVDKDIVLVLLFPQAPLSEYDAVLSQKRIVSVIVPDAAKNPGKWPSAFMPRLLKEHRIDIFHQPFNADGAFFRAPCPVVVSILDLIPWIVPGISRRVFKFWRYKARNILWAHTAAKVLTISQASQRDIVRLCRVPASKVTVTLLGADDIYSGEISADDKILITTRLNIAGKKYIVNMGGLNQLRRNPDFILEGFGRYLRESGDDCYLVITGSVLKQGGFLEKVQAKIAAEGIQARVIVTGFLSNKELKVVLLGAQVSVITSLYEGFCLPLTESFACGVPSIANNRGSIPEIAGDVAVLVDPDKPAELAQQLGRIMNDDVLRTRMICQGLERVKMFQWEQTARQTLDVYRSIIEGKR